MKKFIKSNFLIIISILILLIIVIQSIYQYNKFIKEVDAKINYACNQKDLDEETKKICKITTDKNYKRDDFYSIFKEIAHDGVGQKTAFTMFLFIVIPALYHICKNLKNKFILNELTRKSYKKTIKDLFKSSYTSVWIFPIIIIIIFLISVIYTKSLNGMYSLENSTTGWSEFTLTHPWIFISCFLFNVVIHSVLYINISLCVVRKYQNYFVAIIISFLVFIGLEAFLEIFLGGIIFTSIFHTDFGMIVFNIINSLTFNDTFGIIPLLTIPLIITLISSFILYLFYKDKEKLIIDIEKNE